MKTRRMSPSLGLMLSVPFVAMGIYWLLSSARSWQEQLVIRQWREKAEGLSDEAIPRVMEELAAFGDLGVAALVEGLGSNRESVAKAAGNSLLATLDRWELLPIEDGSPKLALLAERLSDSVDGYGLTGRNLAADLAYRILLCSTDREVIDRSQLIDNCHRVLLAASTDEPTDGPTVVGMDFPIELSPQQFVSAQRGTGQTAGDRRTDSQLARASHASQAEVSVKRMERPSRVSNLGSQQEFGRQELSSEMSPTESVLRFSASSDALPASPPVAPGLLTIPGDVQPLPLRSNGSNTTIHFGQIASPGPGHSSDPRFSLGGTGSANKAAKPQPIIATMWQLHDKANRMSAETRLRSQGYGEVEIEIARRLTDPDRSVRRQLVDQLPNVPGLDARRWLYWLCEDGDADVRLAALTLLATSRDPEVLSRVLRLASQDRDPRVSQLARRLRQRQHIKRSTQ